MKVSTYFAIAAFGIVSAIGITAVKADISPLRRSVIAYYASSNTVQRAVYRDACLHWDMFKENHTARARLKHARDIRRYDLIADELSAAYETVEPTDGELEQVQKDFCSAARSSEAIAAK